jgi:arylsulfatase A-like enzyme
MKVSFFALSILVFLLGCRHTTSQATFDVEPNTDKLNPTAQPNIIFLLSDDQRYDALGMAGNRILQTHNLDSLARNGLYFTNACATSAICCVSRASILSGQYARRHNITDFYTNFSEGAFEQTFPMLLKKAGYNIGFVGKFGVGEDAPYQKYDYWEGFNGQGHYMEHDAHGKPIHLLRLTDQHISKCIDKFAGKEEPFFLQVSFKSPHADDNYPGGEEFISDPAYNSFYNNVNWQLPEAAQPQYFNHFPKVFTANNEARNRWNKRFSSPNLISKSLQGYYRLVHQMDDVIGNLLAQLRQKNIAKNTIIIFASDNGFYYGEYGFADKWFGSAPSIRIPMMVYDPRPKSPRGVKSNAMALNIDIAATILQYAQIPQPLSMQGKPLPQLSQTDERKDFFYEHIWENPNTYIPSTEGVVGKRYKYMRYFKGADSTHLIFEELYDAQNDPNEIHNLIDNPSWASVKDSLKNRLWALKREVK